MPAPKKTRKAAPLTPHQRRVRARLERLVEPARFVARRARAGEPIAPDQLRKAFEGFAQGARWT